MNQKFHNIYILLHKLSPINNVNTFFFGISMARKVVACYLEHRKGLATPLNQHTHTHTPYLQHSCQLKVSQHYDLK